MAPPALTVPDLLRARAAEDPMALALVVDGGDRLTYGQWKERSEAAARGLVAHGARLGDRIALLFDNARWTDYAVAYVAALAAGAVAVPLGPRFATPELVSILEHCGAAGVVCPPDLAPARSPGWVVALADLEEAGREGARRLEVAVGPTDLAEILYTSGTTGRPKGVALSHENVLFHDPPPEPEVAGEAERASFVHSFPIGTNAGQEVLRVPLRRGDRTAVVLPVFEPDRFCALVAEHRVRRLQLVPAMAEMILSSGAVGRHDLSSVERVVLSSAPASPALIERVAAALPHAEVWNTYALTEAGTARTLMVHDGSHRGSVGRGVGGTEVRVVDDDGNDVPAGEIGEVWLRRPGAPVRHYYGDPEATAEAFAGEWVRTGDMGHLDEDGYLYLDDRKKDLVITGGLNVSSIEVEALLGEHPAVAEAAVFGVPHDVLGQDVAAAVVLRAPADERELRAFVRERLAEHKTPHRIFFVDRLPRNASGKVLKRELRATLGAGDAVQGQERRVLAAAGTAEEAVVLSIWAEVLQREDVGIDDDFFALGGHSLAAAQIVARVNDALGVDLPPDAVFDAPTVAELAGAAGAARRQATRPGRVSPGVPRTMPRTMARELAGLVDQTVRLCGWVEAVVDDGNGPVVVLRDPTGFAVLQPDPADGQLAAEVSGLRPESAVVAEGRVAPLEPAVDLYGKRYISTAGSEGAHGVVLDRLDVVGPALAGLPINEHTPVEQRLDWRFIDLRRPRNRLIFEVQTTVEHAMREVWRREGFVELHSPKFRPTPNKSGSELFAVEYFGRKAYLAQSPQFYKQMAMASGLDRIFEIGPVFRANPLITSRHDTEFTSVDVEISWIDSHHDVMAFEERWLRHVLEVVQATHADEIARWFGVEVVVPEVPFPRVHMADAHKILEAAGHEVKGKAEGDLDAEGERLVAREVRRELGHEFAFVTDYPEWIRPYYHMRSADDPTRTRSFDLLWKGLEVTTGAQREHRPDRLAAQASARGVPLGPIEFYLDFFRFGCPPHGGFGLGLTRFLMSLLEVDDVRQVTYLHRGPQRITP